MQFSAFQLKCLALVFMLLEHFSRYFPQALPSHGPIALHYTGRIVAPIFFFLAVDSYFKTQHRSRYLRRLYLWAVVMQIGNLALTALIRRIGPTADVFAVHHNIFLSLAIGISMIAALDWARTGRGVRQWSGWVLAGLCACASLLTEASYNGLAMFLVFYACYNNTSALSITYVALSIGFFIWGFVTNRAYFWVFEYQWMMLAALPLLLGYTGERGRYRLKYLFYAVYPVHIWIFYSVSHLMT